MKISEMGLKHSSAKLLPGNQTILFTSRAGIGDMAIMKTDGSTNQGFQSWIINPLKTNIYFLYSMGNLIKKEAIRKASGSTFLEISNSEVKKLQINYPPKPEQDKIGNLFSKLDETITLLQRKYIKQKITSSYSHHNLTKAWVPSLPKPFLSTKISYNCLACFVAGKSKFIFSASSKAIRKSFKKCLAKNPGV